MERATAIGVQKVSIKFLKPRKVTKSLNAKNKRILNSAKNIWKIIVDVYDVRISTIYLKIS